MFFKEIRNNTNQRYVEIIYRDLYEYGCVLEMGFIKNRGTGLGMRLDLSRQIPLTKMYAYQFFKLD